jgi:beta-glucosidase
MLLAPGINIIRTPLCGRNFEYQTEDPYLNKVSAVAMVKGVQSQRIAACVKHYAVNNQEFNRFKVSSQVNERALHEIYLPGFEATVKEADAWSFMASYNRINGIFGCEHEELVRNTLMDDWGFRGFLVSDWFATRYTNTIQCMKTGLTLEMPGNIKLALRKNQAFCYNHEKIMQVIEDGTLSEKLLDDNLKRILRVMFLVGLFDDPNTLPQGKMSVPEHHAVAREIAEESIVLLKNQNEVLPLNIDHIKKLAVIGPNSNKKHSFGGGSAIVRAKYEITPLKGIKSKCKGKVKIISKPEKADAVILVVGLSHKKFYDSENVDKLILELPSEQIELINETVKKNPKTIIILINGSPISMDGWLENVPAVLEAWYPGMEGGNAIANIIFGDVNPSGKLPVTFPKSLVDSPAHESYKTYPGIKTWNDIKEGDVEVEDEQIRIKYGHGDKVHYDEGVFVGYRHFDTKNIEPLFPFGHGLSYTNFKYDNLKISKEAVSGDENFTVSVDISNSGNRAGAEVAQLYVQDVESSVERPLKELKGFNKVKLEPGAKETISFELGKKDLSFYDIKSGSWIAEKGQFNILVGSSSRDIRLEGKIEYIG